MFCWQWTFGGWSEAKEKIYLVSFVGISWEADEFVESVTIVNVSFDLFKWNYMACSET